MKIFRHIRMLEKTDHSVSGQILLLGVLPFLSFAILAFYYPELTALIPQNSWLRNLLTVAAFFIILESVIPASDTPPAEWLSLFRLLRFSSADFIICFLFFSAVKIPFAALTVSMILDITYQLPVKWTILPTAILMVSLVCCRGLWTFRDPQAESRFPAKHFRFVMRCRSRVSASLQAVFLGDNKRVSVWLDAVIIAVQIGFFAFRSCPVFFTEYVALSLGMCMFCDFCGADCRIYILNRMLRRYSSTLRREKRIWFAVFSLAVIFLSSVLSLPFARIDAAELVISAVICLINFNAANLALTHFNYNRYPDTVNHMILTAIFAFPCMLPGIGFLCGIFCAVKERLQHD